MAKEILGFRLILSGVKEERGQRPRWIGYYSYINLNSETLPIFALSAIQYGRALDHLIRDVIIANPVLGPVHALKMDVSNGFYHIGLRPMDDPNLGIVFPSEGEGE